MRTGKMIIHQFGDVRRGYSGGGCDINHIVDTGAYFRYGLSVRCRFCLRLPNVTDFRETLTEGLLSIDRARRVN